MTRRKEVDFNWTKRGVELRLGRTETSRSGWYNLQKWVKLRNYVLANEPLCRMCLKNDKITPAVLVDHIIAVEGTTEKDYKLFFDFNNLQPLCDRCHTIKTNRDGTKFSEANLQRGRDLMDELES